MPNRTWHDAVRALVAVIEGGAVNSEQKRLLQHVALALGDITAIECPHPSTAYEEGDRLICQECRADITPAL